MPRTASTRTLMSTNNLVDDVPEWMLGSAYTWIKRFTREVTRVSRVQREREEQPARERIHAIERYLQISFANDPDDPEDIFESMMNYVHESPTKCLDVIEAIVATNNNVDMVLESLNQILVESGSKWKAIKNEGSFPSLEERVDTTTKEAFDAAITASTNDSGYLLAKAWGYVFGRNPSPSEAYNYAIKAMEAATWPIVAPQDNSATLGHILGELKVNPTKWRTSVTEKESNLGILMLASSMQLVWQGHTDRHGTAQPVPVSQQAAEQAVFTAVLVCAYFNRGYVGLV